MLSARLGGSMQRLAFSVIFLFVALLPQCFSYFLGDPGVFGQMIKKNGPGFSNINDSSIKVFVRGETLIGVVNPALDLRVLDLLKYMLPSVAATLGIEESDPQNPFNIPVSNFSVNMMENEWSVGTKEFPTLTLVDGFVSLSDVTVVVTLAIDINANSLEDKLDLRGFAVAGIWQIGNIELDFKISKTASGFYFRGAPASGEIPVGQFLTYLGAAILPEEFAEQLENAGLDRFSIQRSRFIGTYGTDGFAIGLSGNPTINGWGSFRCHLIVTRYFERSYQPARTAVSIAINLPSFSLAGLALKLTGYDISDLPILGTLTVPETGVIISTSDLAPNFVPEVFDGILTQARPIKKGVTLVAAIPIVPNQSPVIFAVNIGGRGLTLTIADPGQALTLGNILSAIVPDFRLDELELPPGISDIFETLLGIQLFGFSLSTKPKTLAVELKLGRTLEVIPGIARIIDPSLFINITLSKPRTKIVKADGFWEFGSTDFPITIEPAPLPPNLGPKSQLRKAKGFLLTGSGPEISVQKIIQKFDADFLPEELQSILESASLLDFAIERPNFKIPVGTGAKGFQMQLSGRPRINGWSGVTLNGVVNKGSGKAALAVGFEFQNIGLADLVQQITGVNVKALSLLDRSLKVAFTISSRTMEDVTLEGEALSKIPLRRGVSIIAVFTFPSNCDGDSFCEFAKDTLGESGSLQIATTISSLKQFTFFASVNNINLGGGVILSEAGLEFAIGVETYAGIRGTLALSDPPISFTGAVRVGIQGLELSMTMNGIWKRAFGINFLAFGNGIISITLKPGVPLPGLELGGEIRIGKLDSGREIIAQCYLGFDPVLPRRNYFYGSINRLTIGALLEAFDIDISLPTCLAQSGLPDGLLVSFAFDSRELVPSGIVIPQGLVLNGTIDILGWRLKMYVNVGLPRGIQIDIRMDPLNIGGGVLKLYKSRNDKSSGPLLVADVTVLPPSINVTASGYVSLFFGLLEREIFLQITNTHFLFWIRGRFFLFDALLRVYAPYGSLQEASFQVYGLLSLEWLDKIREKALEAIDNAAKAATKKISEAQGKVRAAESKFDSAVATLREKRNNVNNLCGLRSCGRVCMGCPSWNSCCTRWWGSCIGCPGWNSCCWTAPDLICEAANLGCKALRGVAYAALWLAEKIVDNSRWTLDVAVGVLEAAKVAVKVGAEAAKFIVNLGLGGIINIKKIEFDVKIGLVSTGHFRGSIVVSFLGRLDKTLSFELRLKSLKDMALDLADAVFPGISGRKKREVSERLRRALPDYSRRHYLPELYVYRPGSEAESRRLKQKLKYSYKKTDFVARKRSLNEDIQESARVVEETLQDWRAKAKEVTESNPALIEPTVENVHVLKLTSLAESLNSDSERCKHFYDIADFIKEIPEAIEKVYEGWKESVRNYTKTKHGMAKEYENIVKEEEDIFAKVNKTEDELEKFETEENNQTDLIAEWKQLDNVTSEPAYVTEEEEEYFKKNMTKEGINRALVKEIGSDYDSWNATFKSRLVVQNRAAVRSLLRAYSKAVLSETGHELPKYLDLVFNALATPYKEISVSDARYDSAQNLLESITVIRQNLNEAMTNSLFIAKTISDNLIRELKEIDEIQIFCAG